MKETKTPSKVVDVEPQKMSVAPAQKQLNFECDKCGLSYGLRKNLLYHQRLKHSNYIKKFMCPECKSESLTYSSVYMLKRHLKDHHKKDVNIGDILEATKKIRNTKKGNTNADVGIVIFVANKISFTSFTHLNS